MNQSLKIDPYGFREYDARWIYEKDINAEGITNLGKGLGTQIIKNTKLNNPRVIAVSYTHLRAHETLRYLVCRLLLEKKK